MHDGRAILDDADVDNRATPIATDDVRSRLRHAGQTRQSPLRLGKKRRALPVAERNEVTFLERQSLTRFGLRKTVQSVEVDDPDLELLTKELAREGKDERDSEHGHTLGRYIRSDIQC